MKKAVSRLYLTVIGWLGLAGCLIDPNPADEYGIPYADFKLSGRVVDAASTDPVPGIEITFQNKTVQSNSAGQWSIAMQGRPFPKLFFITTADVDSLDNGGLFDPDTLSVNPLRTRPGSGWYSGVYEQHNIEITLDKTE